MSLAPWDSILSEVRLARDPRRLIGVPLAGVLGGAALVGGGLLLLARGPVGVMLLAAGLLVAITGAYLALRLASVRLLVKAGSLEVRWIGGRREYLLVRGQLARLSIEGRSTALRMHLGPLGVGLGRATLPSNERIELVRLSGASSFLMVPTDRGRLAIAAESEADLLSALRAAAAPQPLPSRPPMPAAPPSATPSRPDWPSERQVNAPLVEPSPRRYLTGIERALMEERQAAERAAALAVAEAQAPEPEPQPSAPPPSRERSRSSGRGRERGRTAWARPGWWTVPAWLPGSGRLAGSGIVIAPLLIAAAGWTIAFGQQRLGGPSPETRYYVLALALTGPLAVFATLVARSWQPRITGLVAWSAIGAQVVIARALFG